jgi:hypothetical protein
MFAWGAGFPLVFYSYIYDIPLYAALSFWVCGASLCMLGIASNYLTRPILHYIPTILCIVSAAVGIWFIDGSYMAIVEALTICVLIHFSKMENKTYWQERILLTILLGKLAELTL